MSAVLDEEAAERQRAKDAAAAAALAAMAESEPKQEEEEEEEVATMPEKPVPVPESVPVAIANGGNVLVTTKPEAMAPVIPMPRTVVTAATPLSPPFQGVFCRDMAVVGTLLSRGGFDRPIPVKCEAMSC